MRQDILDKPAVHSLTHEIRLAGMTGLFIVRDPAIAHTAGIELEVFGGGALEIGNEEDSKMTPKEYHRYLMDILAGIHSSVPVFTAGITTTDRKRLDWLRAVYALGVPSHVNTAIHTYRQETPPWEPKPGFKSRAEEYAEVRRIIGPRRRLIVSEIGWHTAPYKTGGFLGWGKRTITLSDAAVAKYALEECRIAAANGVESLTYFQLNDGPDPANYEHRFGIRRQDGSWKPVAAALSEVVK